MHLFEGPQPRQGPVSSYQSPSGPHPTPEQAPGEDSNLFEFLGRPWRRRQRPAQVTQSTASKLAREPPKRLAIAGSRAPASQPLRPARRPLDQLRLRQRKLGPAGPRRNGFALSPTWQWQSRPNNHSGRAEAGRAISAQAPSGETRPLASFLPSTQAEAPRPVGLDPLREISLHKRSPGVGARGCGRAWLIEGAELAQWAASLHETIDSHCPRQFSAL